MPDSKLTVDVDVNTDEAIAELCELREMVEALDSAVEALNERLDETPASGRPDLSQAAGDLLVHEIEVTVRTAGDSADAGR
jgi:hypothetical protein